MKKSQGAAITIKKSSIKQRINYLRWVLPGRILAWFIDHEPVRCVSCGSWIFNKEAKRKMLTTGAIATLCKKCEEQIFHPWSAS